MPVDDELVTELPCIGKIMASVVWKLDSHIVREEKELSCYEYEYANVERCVNHGLESCKIEVGGMRMWGMPERI